VSRRPTDLRDENSMRPACPERGKGAGVEPAPLRDRILSPAHLSAATFAWLRSELTHVPDSSPQKSPAQPEITKQGNAFKPMGLGRVERDLLGSIDTTIDTTDPSSDPPKARSRTEWPQSHGARRSRERSRERSAEEGMLKPGTIDRDQLNGSSGSKSLGLGFRDTCFDGDLYSIFHRIFEGYLYSKQAVLVGRFGFERFYLPC